MYYSITGRELAPADVEKFGQPEPGVGLMTLSEAVSRRELLGLDDFELESFKKPVRHFHAGIESRDDHSLILINAINRDNVEEYDRIAFLLRRDKLLLIQIEDADDSVSQGFGAIINKRLHSAAYETLMYDLFAQFLENGEEILDDAEEEMAAMESAITAGRLERELNDRICLLRNRVSRVKRYYDELVDVGEALEEDDTGIFGAPCKRFFRRFTDKAARLSQTAQALSENLVYIREALSAALDYNMNFTMKVFTVVSVIFLPLTLIVGWYGMNFSMPEFTWKYGYIGVIVLSIIVVIVCVLYFRKKKYF